MRRLISKLARRFVRLYRRMKKARLTVRDRIILREKVEVCLFKGKPKTKRNASIHSISEDSFSHRLGRWVKRSMTINRRDDRYTERVEDPATGETIHECDELLSEHQGHGSARSKHTDHYVD